MKALKKMGLIGIFKGYVKENRIPFHSLPPEIQELAAPYTEDFLCALKKHLVMFADKD